jgi:ribosomal peptide maturation radical SAM protein 1
VSYEAPRVFLVNAPFAPIGMPHLGTSLVKAASVEAGFSCEVYYASVEFAKRIGFAEYVTFCCGASPMLLPERVFAGALSDRLPPLDVYYREVVDPFLRDLWPLITTDFPFRDVYELLRQVVPRALDYVEEVAALPGIAQADVVAFSSSYGQHVASLAIAQRVKRLHPDKLVVFGGSNCEGPMGHQLVRSFPFVDYAFSGDGDVSFPLFLEALRHGEIPALPGVSRRGAPTPPPPMRTDLDSLPYPDFSDYFDAMAADPRMIAAIPIEGSRGCWWGEKHHCTFCGLNGMTMSFRAKSPERFKEELRHLVERYGKKSVMATDNILDTRWIRSVLPSLVDDRPYDTLFFEVKANLKKAELRILAEAGVTVLQPGIESLSSHVLKLVDKGTTALQNVQLLKWAQEMGIFLIWNCLTGVPGETPEDYQQMAELMTRIPHLRPPGSFARVSIDRFSPYFDRPRDYGIRTAPSLAYPYVYDLPAEQIANLAYWYYYECENGSSKRSLSPPDYARPALRVRAIWERLHGRVVFRHREQDGCVMLEDTRPCAPAKEVRLDALESAVFRLTDAASSTASVTRALLATPRFAGIPAERIAAVLTDLERRMILARDGDRFLALATDAGAPCQAAAIEEPVALARLPDLGAGAGSARQ